MIKSEENGWYIPLSDAERLKRVAALNRDLAIREDQAAMSISAKAIPFSSVEQ